MRLARSRTPLYRLCIGIADGLYIGIADGLDIGIADGVSVARVQACRYSK